jgi:membrane-associated HD superfamily phosphohydrolase
MPGYVFILYRKYFAMKWVMVNNKQNILQEYRLVTDSNTKVIVKYNPIQRSARITAGNKHRLFFIESAGSLSGKYIFKNEYGIEVGALSNNKWDKEGTVIIETKKFIYKTDNDPLAALTIYDSSNKPLVSCGLAAGIYGTPLSLSSQHNNACCNYLLLGLCWFLFLAVTKENIEEYAA